MVGASRLRRAVLPRIDTLAIVREAEPRDAFGISRAQVDTSRATYQPLLSTRILRQLRFAAQFHCWRSILREPNRNIVVHVADLYGELLGFAAGGPARGSCDGCRGEVYALYVLPRHQGRGLGTRLFRSVRCALTERGLSPVLLWVVRTNPARRFFEARGGRLVAPRLEPDDGTSIGKVAYGWPEPRTLGDALPHR
jgi:GNAT superfamily N-acetyltransferase